MSELFQLHAVELDTITFYVGLGLDPNSDSKIIKPTINKYHAVYHPDTFRNAFPTLSLDESLKISIWLNKAKEVLTDTDKKAEYDANIKGFESAHKPKVKKKAEKKGEVKEEELTYSQKYWIYLVSRWPKWRILFDILFTVASLDRLVILIGLGIYFDLFRITSWPDKVIYYSTFLAWIAYLWMYRHTNRKRPFADFLEMLNKLFSFIIKSVWVIIIAAWAGAKGLYESPSSPLAKCAVIIIGILLMTWLAGLAVQYLSPIFHYIFITAPLAALIIKNQANPDSGGLDKHIKDLKNKAGKLVVFNDPEKSK